MGHSLEPKYLRLYGSLLALSENITSGNFIGYAEIAYYGLKYTISPADQENFMGFEL